jgi:hypothetical protein
MAAFGVLERASLVDGHEFVEDSAIVMGCGCTPVYNGREFDAVAYMEYCQAYGRKRSEVAVGAAERWPYSVFGGVLSRLGWIWDQCPHSVIRDATPDDIEAARAIIELRHVCSIGGAAMMGELTAAGATLLSACASFWDHQQAEQDKRNAQSDE